MSRFRPHFSVRTTAIVVTLVCAYFGVWEAMKRHLPKYPVGVLVHLTSPIPFVFREVDANGTVFHLWLLGPKIQLPFASERKEF